MDKTPKVLLFPAGRVTKLSVQTMMARCPMASIDDLLELMQTLRDPEKGCPWDKAQTPADIAHLTVEEAYEVAEAAEENDFAHLKEELGDLLFHIVFYSQIAKEKGLFSFDDVAAAIVGKMKNRHPHIFGAAKKAPDWEDVKAAERAGRHEERILDGVAKTLPAVTRAYKLQNRAARVGFDWKDPLRVIDKINEEISELETEIKTPGHEKQQLDETGDVLFACVNLARKLNIDPEAALKSSNAKFERRFNHIEDVLNERGQAFEDTTLEEMESLWVEAKQAEKSGRTA